MELVAETVVLQVTQLLRQNSVAAEQSHGDAGAQMQLDVLLGAAVDESAEMVDEALRLLTKRAEHLHCKWNKPCV